MESFTRGLNERGEKVEQKSLLVQSELSSPNRPMFLTKVSGAPEAPFVVSSQNDKLFYLWKVESYSQQMVGSKVRWSGYYIWIANMYGSIKLFIRLL